MKKGDVLLKKWCFGVSYNKLESHVEMGGGGAHVAVSFPRYRSIVLRVLSCKKKGKNTFEVEAEQFVSMTAKPKKIKQVFKKTKEGAYAVEGQKKVYHKLDIPFEVDAEMPPVGSLVTLNKRHCLVVSVGRNKMTIFVDGKYQITKVKPGTIRWRQDNIIASMPQQAA
jgi:hypothetical protein|tara:strand:- start:343 stop:846 length:504 start_codon:yes stop_codon:yes gene_type:complete